MEPSKSNFSRRNAILSIRGEGQPACDIAAGHFRRYDTDISRRGWKWEMLFEQVTPDVLFDITGRVIGDGAFGALKAETGPHGDAVSPTGTPRSQAWVEVLPEIREEDFQLSPGDLRIDVYRSGDAAPVRIVHRPTGIPFTCEIKATTLENRSVALSVVRSRVYQWESGPLERGRHGDDHR